MFFGQNVNELFQTLEKEFKTAEIRNNYLIEENKRLKDEHYKDKVIKKLKEQNEELKKDSYRGFPISEKEQEAIDNWKNKHEKEKHGITTLNQKLKAGGCIGGTYSYYFIPTSIGVIGYIKCSCGEEFEFQSL